MKKIFIIIMAFYGILYSSNINENLNSIQSKIIKKIVLNESFLNEDIYDEFWKNSEFDKNSDISKKIIKEYTEVYELKLELWRSAKLSYKYLDIIKTSKLEKIYADLEDRDKTKIFNILIASKIHDNVSIVDDKKVKFNLLFIENMLQKQKNILITFNHLFSSNYSCSFDLSLLNSLYKNIKVCPTVGYEYMSGGLFKKYIYERNNTKIAMNIIKENINLNTCVNIIMNNFFLSGLNKKEIKENKFFRKIEGKNFVYGECIRNNNDTLMLYLYGEKKDILENLSIMKK